MTILKQKLNVRDQVPFFSILISVLMISGGYAIDESSYK